MLTPGAIDYVEIIGDHPWAGHRGQFVTGSTPEMLEVVRLPGGEPMALVQLDDGQRCYAAKCNLRVVSRGRSYTYRG